MQSTKEVLKHLADRLPDNATLNDAMYELYIKQKIERGLQAAKEGRVLSHEDAKKRLLGHGN